ncbi:hypothetical protein BGW38_009975 [Lunasporangiospora selenospora]|uniref:glucan endo-1,3-beta-D-glucosidase n=1 Tax=Lunasporangiospora selenospora TaxID=979761 RepID=A0A9P6KFX5_9FUNG|nr:hypothetical protein BGW38_009975 [Lunasporangiospora selenospora]
MPRSTSDSDFSGNSGNSNASTVRSAWSSANPNDSTRPREIRSTPIYMPVVHHPPPTPKMGQSSINTHLHPPRSPTHTSQGSSGLPSRTPSPNLSTRTLTSQRSQTHLSPNNAPTPQRSLSPFTSSSSLHQQYSSPTSALRPDSVCSYPDSSPLMAPNVLAAVDARLRANAAAATSSVTGGSSQVDLTSSPLNSRPLPFAQGSYSSQGSGMNSRASSVAPVMTHYSALHSSTGVKSREDLYDILNADDDEGGGRSGGGEDLHGGLGKPRPGFIHSSQSKRSSRCNSISSSLAGSGIELNAHHRRSQIDDAPILLTKPSRAKLAGNGTLSHKGSALTSSGSIVNGKREYHSGFEDSTTLNSSPELAPYLERSAWLKSKTKTSRKWRGICCGIGILIFLGAIAGITFGFISGKGKVDGLAPPPDPERPNNKPNPPITQFKPDPNLRKAFYGLDYNPANGLMPWCGATLQSVINDIILMSQLTSRIRLYGMDCNQADLTFQAINALNLNSTMKVVLTVWVDKNATTYQRQYDTLFKVLDTYGTSMVQGISVGNEVLFQGYKTLTELGVLMKDVRTQIKTRYNADIPIFTSDIGNNVNSSLAAVSDELHGNLHPYFSDSKIENAANWTLAQYEERIEGNPTSSGRKGAISEVGWPSAPSSAVYTN